MCKNTNFSPFRNLNSKLITIFVAELTTFLKMISKNQLKFVRQLEQKKYRRREGLFVAEGTKVVGDLLERYEPHSVYATPDWQAPAGITPQIVTPDELQRLSFQQHPQQVLALFPLPDFTPLTSQRLVVGFGRRSGSRQPRHYHPHSRLVWHQHDRLQSRHCRRLESQGGSSHDGQYRARKHILY